MVYVFAETYVQKQSAYCWHRMNFPVDSNTPGAHFSNLTAIILNDHIQLKGQYTASGLIPVILFSVGIPWIEPCTKHLCCLWDVAERYKDHDLQTALGPTCNENANITGLDLMKGNDNGITEWGVRTMVHPSFVAMLFLSLVPTFYMYYEVMPMQWIDTTSVHWKSSWYGQPCHTVLYPNGQHVCITCFNSKPDNAIFVFTANWFTTFQCQWVCKPGYMGPNCEITVDLAVYVTGSVVAVLCLAGLVIFALRRRSNRAPEPLPVSVQITPSEVIIPARTQTPVRKFQSEMIVFKENALPPEIRIKLL